MSGARDHPLDGVDERVAAAKNLLGPIGLLVLLYEESIPRADGGRVVYSIPISRVEASSRDGAIPVTIVPQIVKIVCPHCNRQSRFDAIDSRVDVDRRVAFVTGQCLHPGCANPIYLFAVSHDQELVYLAMHPIPATARPAARDLCQPPIPDHLTTIYNEAIELFESAMWRYVPISCRLIVEACLNQMEASPPQTVGEQLGDKKRPPLKARIDQASADTNWAIALMNTAHGLREAGNLVAHFEHMGPTLENAAACIDLVEAMLRFVYIFPERLEVLLGAVRAARASSAPPPEPPP